jgi:RNA polymerase sigma-70 factor (ECF subfamily)
LVRFACSFVGSESVAEELMEDALVDVLIRDRKFNDEAHFKAYLYKAVRHRCLNYLRFHRKNVPLEDVESVLASGDLESETIKKERDRAVFACLQELPLQYRQVLTLCYFDEFSIDEICAIMSRSKKQVYNLLARANASLKSLLEKVGITYEDI